MQTGHTAKSHRYGAKRVEHPRPFVQAPFTHADFPGMCIYQVGEDVPTDLIMTVGFEESYEQVLARYPGGFENFAESLVGAIVGSPGSDERLGPLTGSGVSW